MVREVSHMNRKERWFATRWFSVVPIVLLMSAIFAAGKETVLHSFVGTSAISPDAVIFDRNGNLYGTTFQGGVQDCSPQNGCGTVFKLVRTSKGWRYQLLYTFQGGFDGANPSGGLVFDSAGNLYGTTIWGGAVNAGTVFELKPSKGGWTESIIHSFGQGSDGSNPRGGLTLDSAGNLYGTAWDQGAYGGGAVYKLAHSKSGWNESIIYDFGVSSHDGVLPVGRVIFNASGDIYGATQVGGSAGLGTVFKLSRSNRGWMESVIHSFVGGNDGDWPEAGLIFDSVGNLYGTTVYGGGSGLCGFGCGTVFQLKPKSSGGWTTSIIHAFGLGKDGATPFVSLALDSAGNFFGTTWGGGADGDGTVFKLTPSSGRHWKESVVHMFTAGRDGGQPQSSVVFDAAGNVYGCTFDGGATKGENGDGVVFKITP
jgi:uncharacterized repeat protein (TIGR03803 family)